MVEFLSSARVHLFGEQPENHIARGIERRIAGAPAGITMLLTPTVLRGSKRMVAGEAGELSVFRPDISFIVALVLRAPHQAVHERLQLYGLSGTPFANANPGGILGGLSSGSRSWLLPMTR